ncbi:hypothetical protein [Micromonospora sp. NPDC006431]
MSLRGDLLAVPPSLRLDLGGHGWPTRAYPAWPQARPAALPQPATRW